MENELTKKKTGVEVINISNIGIGPQSYYIILKDIALKYHPDIVILNVYANDASKITRDSYLKKLIKDASSYSHLLALLRNLNRRVNIIQNREIQAQNH